MVPKGLTPRSVALRSAALIALSVGGAVLVASFIFPDRIEHWWALVLFAGSFLLSSFFISFGIRKFIQSRVDQIHRTVHELKTGKDSNLSFEMDSDVLGQVNEDVQEWAKEKREEIDELKERESYRREFIGNLAHELKTPITSIQGYILTLLEGGLEDDNVNRDFLERASKGVDRLTAIVEDMDTITRLEEGVMDLEMERVDLHRIVDEAINSMRMQAKKAGINLNSRLNPETMVLCDEDRIMQVFINLLNNAIKYGKEGGSVTISGYPVKDRMMIEISDDGIGIEAEHLPRLFERFYRVGSSRSRHEGGSGLGLAIVKHIIEAHGQAISVVSMPQEGTRFTFSLAAA